MKYEKFQRLIKGKEKYNVDFKIRCDAFLSKSIKPKAELAKDICAMANNGNVASYILIGVSDDGKSFESVSNNKLKDDNLQNFCKSAIFPPPKVKVFWEKWTKVSSNHAGKNFIMIQIGPHAKQAFRIARDFVSYKQKICYHKNEVWIRRGAISDLATPEEVTRLVRGEPLEKKSRIEDNIQYSRLSRNEKFKAIFKDFKNCVEEIGGCIYGSQGVILLRNLKYVWRIILLEECTQKFANWYLISQNWQYEHGILFLVVGSVSKRAFHPYVEINFKEKWGWFTFYNIPNYFVPKTRVSIPVNTKNASLVSITLPNLSDTYTLRNSFHSLLQFLNDEEDSYNRIRLAHDNINKNLRKWLKQGWLIETNRHYVGCWPKKSELGENEIFNKRYGYIVLRREKREELINMAQTVLDLSAGRLP